MPRSVQQYGGAITLFQTHPFWVVRPAFTMQNPTSMTMMLGIAILAGLTTAILLFRTFFRDGADFLDCVRFYLTPDWISLLRGEYTEDFWAETKLFVYLALCAGVGFGVYWKFH